MAEKTVFIVGAGFSANAGLPLQAEFTELFLKAQKFKRGKSRKLMPHLGQFVEKTFGFNSTHDLTSYPELEDMFTLLDLSANTGHHLGISYSPKELRMLRRMLLSRTIHMLNSAYLDGKAKARAERKRLLEFMSKLSPDRHQFVSLNWDVVLEGCLEEVEAPFSPFYSPEIRPGVIEDDALDLPKRKATTRQMLVAKMHGSINWLYCDCCRRTYSVPVSQVSRLGSQVLKSDEVEKLYGNKGPNRLACPFCTVDLGVRLATFSFQKALRATMFESSWLEAEKALRRAQRWVFIGYSLPAADFEFKYLLKRVQLAREEPPEIIVVTKTDDPRKSLAIRSYRKFFGEGSFTVFAKGFTSASINKILGPVD
jgi:NAD-dependent SIR2 family protein deacetylase